MGDADGVVERTLRHLALLDRAGMEISGHGFSNPPKDAEKAPPCRQPMSMMRHPNLCCDNARNAWPCQRAAAA
jgi:hypothetical protein